MKMKIKLRDLTLSQYHSYRQDICENTFCETRLCPFDRTNCCEEDKDCWLFNKDLYSDKLLDREIEIEVEPIFTDKEREYLHNLLKPFKDRMEEIKLLELGNFGKDRITYLRIIIKSILSPEQIESISLPYFKFGTMYDGLALGKAYRNDELKELLRELNLL